MTTRLQLDTHVLVWLYAGALDRFPPSLRERLNSGRLVISPMARLELRYLHEIGRLTDDSERIVSELSAAVGLTEDDQPFSRVVELAERVTFTRDPFDRLIVSQALAAKDPLVTKDERIRRAYAEQTLWD